MKSDSSLVIRTENEHFVIQDLNSSNGTFINGERVNAGLLKEGSLIGIGSSLFLFKLPKDHRSEISDPRQVKVLFTDLYVYQTVLHSVANQSCNVMNIETLHECPPVRLNRFDTDVQGQRHSPG